MPSRNPELVAQMTGMWRSLSDADQEAWLVANGLERIKPDSTPQRNSTVNELVLTPHRGSQAVSVVGDGSQPRSISKFAHLASPPRSGQALRIVDIPNETAPAAPLLNVSGARVTDEEIKSWFDELDLNKNGWLSKEEFRRMYLQLENFGAPVNQRKIEEMLKSMHALDDDRITYDEFAYLVLHVAKQ